MLEHLLERGVNPQTFKGLTVGDGFATFWLYEPNGRIVGYQRYNPNGIKTADPNISNNDKKYYVYLSDLFYAKGNKAALWGWQYYNPNAKYIFLVEGIFDAAKIVNCNMCTFATLGNNPRILKQQIWLLSQKHIIVTVADNDSAGQALKKFGKFNLDVPNDAKDLGEMEQLDVCSLLNKFK